ncbi:unnamed protein product, partial [Laminaria digitata]
ASLLQHSSACCRNADSYVAGTTNGSVRGEVGLRRGGRLAGLPGARARNDPQPEHQQGHEESLPDRELRLSRTRLHEPHGVGLLGGGAATVPGGVYSHKDDDQELCTGGDRGRTGGRLGEQLRPVSPRRSGAGRPRP